MVFRRSVLTLAAVAGLISCSKDQSADTTQKSSQPAVQSESAPAQQTPAGSVADSIESTQSKTQAQTGSTESMDAANSAASPADTKEAATSGVQLDPNAIQFAAYDTHGELRKSGEWVGNRSGVVVNIWGTWCGPCRMEIPALVELYEEYKGKGVEIVSMAVNDPPDRVAQYAAKNNMTWVMLMADENSIKPFGAVSAVPTTIFYNARGIEVGRFVGARDHATFKAAFENMLKSS